MTNICYSKTAALLSVEQAQHKIRAAIAGIDDQEPIELPQALGRVLAENIVSPINIPPERNAAMDGYAFASADIIQNQPFISEVVGCSWAGKPFTGTVAAGQCIRIFTGAVVPEFADSVIAQELVERHGEQITLPHDTCLYKNIRTAGSDVKQQETLLTAPKRLTACDLALLAAAGVGKIQVKRRLNIAFFSTGDELTSLGNPLLSGQIYDSNRYLLAGLLADPNHDVTDLGIVRDDEQLLEQVLTNAAQQYDAIISTGGASVGEADFVKKILEKCGKVDFWKLAIKPGKPLAFGHIGNCRFFGLPGNPIAVLVTFHKFVQPALRQLAGAPPVTALQLQARCESTVKKSPGRQEYQRGILSQTGPGQFTVKLAGPQDSHQLKVASLANCFIVLDADCSGVEAGQTVTVEPFDTYI
ncbi:MAG: molybdopterin molybdotransferase MoeA [Methylomonas sp.]